MIGSLRRSLMNSKPPVSNYEAVDLGLPSGVKWAKMNLGASSETEAGLYFAWGETTGYASAADRNAALGLTGGFDSTSYNAGSAVSISADLTLAQDAAHIIMGGTWRMPTKEEFQELYNNTDYEIVNGYIPSVNGIKFMKKSDHNVYMFIPFSSMYLGTTIGSINNESFCWASSIYSDSSNAYTLFINRNNKIRPAWVILREYGCTIRAVMD